MSGVSTAVSPSNRASGHFSSNAGFTTRSWPTARWPPRTAAPSQPPGLPGPYASCWSMSGRPARCTVRRLTRVPVTSAWRPSICSSRSTRRAVGASRTRVVMCRTLPCAETSCSGSQRSSARSPTPNSVSYVAGSHPSPGRATVAAAESTVSRAPSPTRVTMVSRSPPSGALMAPTTVTRAPDPVVVRVRRRASGPSPASTGSEVTPRPSRAAVIRAVARTLMRSRRRAARGPSRRRVSRRPRS